MCAAPRTKLLEPHGAGLVISLSAARCGISYHDSTIAFTSHWFPHNFAISCSYHKTFDSTYKFGSIYFWSNCRSHDQSLGSITISYRSPITDTFNFGTLYSSNIITIFISIYSK